MYGINLNLSQSAISSPHFKGKQNLKRVVTNASKSIKPSEKFDEVRLDQKGIAAMATAALTGVAAASAGNKSQKVKEPEKIYREDGTLEKIIEYGPNGKKTKETEFWLDGETIWRINEYDLKGKLTKETFFQVDGEAIDCIKEYDSDGKRTKRISFQKNGKTISCIHEYDSKGKLTKATFFNADGKTIDYINEYDSNGMLTKRTHF